MPLQTTTGTGNFNKNFYVFDGAKRKESQEDLDQEKSENMSTDDRFQNERELLKEGGQLPNLVKFLSENSDGLPDSLLSD